MVYERKMPAESLMNLSNPFATTYKHMHEAEQMGARSLSVLIPALRELLKIAHPNLVIRPEALSYVEGRLQYVLEILCAEQPHTISDVEARINHVFPNPLIQMSINFAKAKKKLLMPVAKLHPIIQKEYLSNIRDKDTQAVTSYLCAILEFLASDILKVAGKYIINIRHSEITEEDVRVSIFADKVIMELFSQDEDDPTCLSEFEFRGSTQKGPLSYEDLVKDLISEEKAFLRELKMVKKVFRPVLEKMCPAPVPGNGVSPEEMAAVFGEIDDVYNTSMDFVDSLEDALEMDSQSGGGWIGVRSVFEDIIEAQEFDVFRNYAVELLSAPNGRENGSTSPGLPAFETLNLILNRPFVERHLKQIVDAPGLLDAFRYVLPKLLMSPVFRVFQYADFLRLLHTERVASTNVEDAEVLQQVEGILRPIVEGIDRILNNPQHRRRMMESHSRIRNRTNRTRAKVTEILKSVEGWGEKETCQKRLDFVLEGDLTKLSTRERRTDRHVFLFETCIVFCKAKQPKPCPGSGGAEFRYKEMMPLHRTYIIDKDDSEDAKWAFDVIPRDQPNLNQIICARNNDEKNLWLGSLFMLQTRGMLDRLLEKTMENEDRANPLRLPMQEMYPFAEPDSPQNLVLEDGPGARGVPLIRGAILVKLIERLTYHQYADPAFVKTFLITFRSFTTPMRLLDLLIERFKIPPPTENGDLAQLDDYSPAVSAKRFRKEYCQPVQFRVLNVMRHWVDNHFLDFESDGALLQRLKDFLSEIGVGKRHLSMKKWADSISKIIERKERNGETVREMTFYSRPPIEWHLREEEFDLMTLHPKEIARQLTLFESEQYRAIKPSELIDWNTKDQNENASLSLWKCIRFSTKISDYIRKYVLMTENLEERVAVMSRLIDIMVEFEKLNNFTGLMEVHAALESASLHRLEKTKELLASKNAKRLKDLLEDCPSFEHGKNYFAKLRRINPPCIPFLGQYLSQLHFFEKGNASYLNNTENLPNVEQRLINFNQRRKIADIVTEIQQYQNQPYCLEVEPEIRNFFVNLDPYDGLEQPAFDDSLWNQSLKIEPKNCAVAPKFPKRFKFSLRSPSQKPAPISATGRMSQAISSISINSNVTSPSTQPICEGYKSKTPSTPSTPHSPMDQNAAYMEAVAVDTPRLSITTPYGEDSRVPSSPLTSDLPSDTPPPIPPRQRRLSTNGNGEFSPRDHPTPKSSDSVLSAKLPFTFDGPPPPIPQRQNSNASITTLDPATGSCSAARVFFPARSTDDLSDDWGAPPPPLPPRKLAPKSSLLNGGGGGAGGGGGGGAVPELPPKTLNRTSRKHSGDTPGF